MIFFKIFIVLYVSACNFLSLKYFNILLFDLLIFTILAITFPYINSIKKGIYIYLLLTLLVISYLLTLYFTCQENAKFKDFLVYSKIFYYLLFSILISSSKINFSVYSYIKIYKFIVLIFFSEYLITQCLGINLKHRPSLFVENNFEIIFLIILYIISEQIFNLKSRKYSIMVCFSVFSFHVDIWNCFIFVLFDL